MSDIIQAYIPYPSVGDLKRNKLPLKQNPRVIVVHAMAENIKSRVPAVGAIPFLNENKLSAHIICDPSGQLFRCRADDEIAWHAKGFNLDSLGIEFLLPGDHDYTSFKSGIAQEGWVSNPQFEAGIKIIKYWMENHNITRIVRHSDLSPERKTDPGDGFPWQELLHNLGV
jgi:N-acetylmuramoyl-L-alanine amidase